MTSSCNLCNTLYTVDCHRSDQSDSGVTLGRDKATSLGRKGPLLRSQTNGGFLPFLDKNCFLQWFLDTKMVIKGLKGLSHARKCPTLQSQTKCEIK